MLLSLARSIFEEQNDLDSLVSKILTQARDLIKCERCVVFLLDLECEEAVRIFWQHILSSFFLIFHFQFLRFILSFYISEPFRTLWSQARKLYFGKKIVYQKCNIIVKKIKLNKIMLKK